MVTEFIPFGSRINEYFEGCIKKKPLKSYDFKGFNSICLSARGESSLKWRFQEKQVFSKKYYPDFTIKLFGNMDLI